MKVHFIRKCSSFQNHVRIFSEGNCFLDPQALKKIQFFFNFGTRSSLLLLFLYWYSPGRSIDSYLKFQRTWLGTWGSVTTCQRQPSIASIHSPNYGGLHVFQGRNLSEPAKRDEPHSPETSDSLTGGGSLFTTGQEASATGQYFLFPDVHPICFSLHPQLPPLLLLQDTLPINYYFGAWINYSNY